MDLPYQQNLTEGQLHPRLPSQKLETLPRKLQKNSIPRLNPLIIRIQFSSLGSTPPERHRKTRKIQRQAARFITGDYSSRDQGCVTRMLKDLPIPLLQDRRKANRLIFFYNVVEGPCHDYLTQIRNKRQIKSKQFTDCITQSIIDKQCATNSSKCFKPIQCNSVSFRNLFFPRTVIDWNHQTVLCVQRQ